MEVGNKSLTFLYLLFQFGALVFSLNMMLFAVGALQFHKQNAVEECCSSEVGRCDGNGVRFGEMNQCASVWAGWRGGEPSL
jgi:hypothetical protein